MKDQQKNTFAHGECIVSKINTLPKGLKKVSKGKKFRIAESEVTGNHHFVECDTESTMYVDENGVLYLDNRGKAGAKCVVEERHSTIPMEPGIWEIAPGKEYDYDTQEVRNIAD